MLVYQLSSKSISLVFVRFYQGNLIDWFNRRQLLNPDGTRDNIVYFFLIICQDTYLDKAIFVLLRRHILIL